MHAKFTFYMLVVPTFPVCFQMCVNQKCMSVENMWAAASVAQCPNNCNNNGVCNSRGHCHCNMGFAPPHCDYPGPGGSQDSGPASDPNGNSYNYLLILMIYYFTLWFLKKNL